jgi:hypothetical protein
MRWLLFALLSSFLWLPPTLAQDQPKPIGPAEAAKKVNEEVTLRMEVKSAALRKEVCFLNSEEDYKDAKNFTLFIDKEVLTKFKKARIEDPAAHFKGKTVQVTGKVTLYRERPEIKLTGPEALKVIQKKPDKNGQEKEPAAKEPALRQELLAMVKEDQQVRASVVKALADKGIPLGDAKSITDPALLKIFLEQTGKMSAVDQKNRARLKQVVDKHGWPGKSVVGKDGAHAAWLLVQHADGDLAFQKRCLSLMQAATKGDVEPQDIAYLTDRILVAQRKKQRYGTQLQQRGGRFTPQPIEDEGNVDKRRAKVGLPPLAEYLTAAQAEYDKLSGKQSEKK